MGIATEMKNLTQDIASSIEDRLTRVGEIKEETKQLMGEAQDLVKNLKTSRRQVGTQLRKDLAQETTRRESTVKAVLEDAERLVRGFHRSRKEGGARMHKELAKGAAERRSEVSGILANATQAVRGFRSQRKGMSSQLRSGLARSRTSNKSAAEQIARDARGLITGFREAQSKVRAELQEARAAWQGLAATKIRMTSKVKPSVAEEEVVEVAVAEEEAPYLEAEMLAAVNEHPNGITLVEVANSLGVVPIVLGRAARSLLGNGKIRKEDKVYFPITG